MAQPAASKRDAENRVLGDLLAIASHEHHHDDPWIDKSISWMTIKSLHRI